LVLGVDLEPQPTADSKPSSNNINAAFIDWRMELALGRIVEEGRDRKEGPKMPQE